MKEIEEEVLNSINQDYAVKTTQEIVRRPAWLDYRKPSSEWEWERAEYYQNKLTELGFDMVPISEVGEVSYRRPTLIGFLRGSERGQPGLFWTAHIDTHCPPHDMQRPCDGQIEDGEVKGLGTADQVGATGAVFGALDAIKKLNIKLKRDFMIFFCSDEMGGARGAELALRWMKKNNVIPEFGIVGEPTGNAIGLAHTGVSEFAVEVQGKTGHPSFKTKNIGLPMHNPVLRMMEVINTLSEIEEKEECFKMEHPLTGPSYTWFGPIIGSTVPHGTCSACGPWDPLLDGMTSAESFGHSTIYGHMQPEYCRILFGVRAIPRKIKPGEMFHTEPEKGTSNKEALEMVDRHLKGLWKRSPSATTYTLKRTRDHAVPYEISADEPHVKLLAEMMEGATKKKPRFLGTKHWTEVGRQAQLIGTPFVQIAPTWVRYHRADEGVPITELMEAARIYTGAILGFCKVA